MKSSGKQRVAILKSRLYKGGVAQVLGHMIVVLNEQGIVPDILTLRSDLTKNDFEKLYRLKIDFNIKLIGPNIKMPYEWHFLYFNLLSRRQSKNYDLFINSNNTSFYAPKNIPTLTYIHYPRKNRVISKTSSIHFPEKNDKSMFEISSDPFYFARFLYNFNTDFGKNEKLIANSEFTKKAIQTCYPKTKKPIEILYPPVESPEVKIVEKKMQVVTLGRISPEKRQLEQIEIALKLPEINFYILGFSDLGKYYIECKSKIENSGAKNIFLLPNLDYSEIQKILSESAIFLHNVRNEPFGIGIVQAASQGCIPVIHRSGGAVEIVNNEKLQFTNTESAIKIIDEIKKGENTFTFTNLFNNKFFSKNILLTIS
jgi:glycosyltransferase involved in cell wall biosynthesis